MEKTEKTENIGEIGDLREFREETQLVGNSTNSVDSKNRVFFPAKFREELGSPIVITVNIDKCLSAYSMEEWIKFVEKLKSLPATKVRKIRRFFCGNAIKVVPDSQGRIVLSKELMEFAGITDTITFVGCGETVEMWAHDKAPLNINDDEFLDEVSDQMLELDI